MPKKLSIRKSKYHKPYKSTPEEIASRKWYREENKRLKDGAKETRQMLRREIKIMKYMKKHDVLSHHHGRQDSQKTLITERLDEMIKYQKENVSKEYHQMWHDKHRHRDPYIWNYQSDGKDKGYMPQCWLNCRFVDSDFDTIYDVPLDGTYEFYCYDSGQRGLGSLNIITTRKIEDKLNVPTVNPGAFRPL